MATQHLLFDKTEFVAGITVGKKYKILNLTYADIVRIQLDPCTERKMLFKKVPSEKITIVTGKHGQPLVYFKQKNKKYWDGYITGLRKFTERNNLHIVDNLQS